MKRPLARALTFGFCAILLSCVGDAESVPDAGMDAPGVDASMSDASTADVSPGDAGSDAGSCGACDASDCFEGVCGGKKIVDVSEGTRTTCVVYASGSVWCWGQGDGGELGVDPAALTSCNDESGAAHPCRPSPAKVPGASNVKRVSVGSQFVCAILADQTVACWGENRVGQLGHTPGQQGDVKCNTGNDCQWARPAVVAGITGVIDVSSGQEGACVIDGQGKVWCWGGNLFDQLGHTGTNGLPAIVAGVSGATSVSTAQNAPHACAVVSGGDVKCWGMNYLKELGHIEGTGGDLVCATYSCNPVPTSLGLTGFEQVVAVQGLTCARKTGAVLCWGDNVNGQLGLGDAGNSSPTPTAVPSLTPSAGLGGGQSAMCSLGVDHSVACWGVNDNGAIGSSDPRMTDAGLPGCANSPCFGTPQTIPSFSASRVSCGWGSCIALALDGTVWGWGRNPMGQTGHLANTASDLTCGTSACAPKPSPAQGLP